MIENLEHLSYSSISSYLACGRNWQFKYDEGLPTPQTPQLALGSAFHNTVETMLQRPGADLLETWQGMWAKQTAQPINWGAETPEQCGNDGYRVISHPEIQKGIQAIKPARRWDLENGGFLLVDAALDVPADAPVKAAIETRVELRVPGVPIPVIGYIDIITEDGVPGDFKTSGRAWSMDKALNEMQPLFYLAALNQAGIKVPGWAFRHYVAVKTQKPQWQVFEHRHNPAQLFFLFKIIQSVWKGIQAGVFVENPTSWKCSPEYCDFWHLCRGKNG